MNQWASMTETEQLARVWSHVDKSGECWTWDVGKRYGSACFKGRRWQAHRLIWTLTNGSIPDDMCVLHRCDNPKCVKPSHLFLGTQKLNVRDAIQKGRHTCNRLIAQTHCKRGHEFTPENTRLIPYRSCRKCESLRRRRAA